MHLKCDPMLACCKWGKGPHAWLVKMTIFMILFISKEIKCTEGPILEEKGGPRAL